MRGKNRQMRDGKGRGKLVRKEENVTVRMRAF